MMLYLISSFSLFQTRQISLEDSVRLFSFYNQCDEFDAWLYEKVRLFYID